MTYEELNSFIVVFNIIFLIYFSVKKVFKLRRFFRNRKLSEADRS